MDRLVQHQQTINDQLARYGVKFGLYKNGTFQERLFPFDPLPRVITAAMCSTIWKRWWSRMWPKRAATAWCSAAT